MRSPGFLYPLAALLRDIGKEPGRFLVLELRIQPSLACTGKPEDIFCPSHPHVKEPALFINLILMVEGFKKRKYTLLEADNEYYGKLKALRTVKRHKAH